MFEFWVMAGGGGVDVYQQSDHNGLMQRALYTQNTLNRGFIALCYYDTANAAFARVYRYTYYSFLLCLNVSMPSAFMVSPIAQVDITPPVYYGAPSGAMVDMGTYCYKRAFGASTVYVNADSVSHTLDGHTIAANDGGVF
jgi:hypothetical protein